MYVRVLYDKICVYNLCQALYILILRIMSICLHNAHVTNRHMCTRNQRVLSYHAAVAKAKETAADTTAVARLYWAFVANLLCS